MQYQTADVAAVGETEAQAYPFESIFTGTVPDRAVHTLIIAYRRTAKVYTVGLMRNLSRSYPQRHTATLQAFQKAI